MMRKNDDIAELFRSRLSGAELTVREGMWEELARDIPAAFRQRRRLMLFRTVAAASVLLLLAVSSAILWHFSPREEIGREFTRIAVSGEAMTDGNGLAARQVQASEPPVTYPSSSVAYAAVSSPAGESEAVEVETESFGFSVTFSFSGVESGYPKTPRQGRNGYWQASGEPAEAFAGQPLSEPLPLAQADEKTLARKKAARAWKLQAGTALPADRGTYKMPVSIGVACEQPLTERLSVEAGLQYTSLRSEDRHLHYIGIPVKANFTLAKNRKAELYAAIGGVAEKCIAGAPDHSLSNEPIQLAATAGVGVRYRLTDRLALFAEPGVSHHFDTDSPLTTVRTRRPTNFNLLCGLRMTY